MGNVNNVHMCHGVMSKLENILDGENRNDGATILCERHENEEENEVDDFAIVTDNPAGNSRSENSNASHPNSNMRCEEYEQTPTHVEFLGLQPPADSIHIGIIENHNSIDNGYSSSRCRSFEDGEDCTSNNKSSMSPVHDEVMKFPTTCPHCQTRTETKMCVINIPHFEKVVIMCLQCEHCGFRSNEIKGGGAIPRVGTKITLQVIDMGDLAREVLKSDTCGVSVPELDFELDEGGLGGMYTTVEGLLLKMHDGLKDIHPFGTGDSSMKPQVKNVGEACSAPRQEYLRYNEFLTLLKDTAIGLRFPFTLILVDPLSNSFVGPKQGTMRCNGMRDDRGLEIEEFERTEDQNETLGLNDIRTEIN
ncbi:hypothetical protein ACHAW5_009453 [Stephanodiscus triporus]|uniref:Zinc finger ZPR1-type domain-containing protein n=1 Tax=Stephanodiscus triporus TaxID=2934178 RepID=A0ABD3QZJ1_9STRA